MKIIERLFKKKSHKKSFQPALDLDRAIRQNGVISRRAALVGRSLDYMERQIIYSVRELAALKGFSSGYINDIEMEGQRDKYLVLEKTKVVAKFAYYQSPYYGHPIADPSFIIVKSNHPILLNHGNFGIEELNKFKIKIPKHPTFDEWDKSGRPVYRGE